MGGCENLLISPEKALRGREHKISNIDYRCHCAVRCAISLKKKSRQDCKRLSLPLLDFWDRKRALPDFPEGRRSLPVGYLPLNKIISISPAIRNGSESSLRHLFYASSRASDVDCDSFSVFVTCPT